MPRIIRSVLCVLSLLVGAVGLANAQSISISGGAGTATDSANGQTIDPIGDAGPAMTGLFARIGVDYLRWANFGVGAEYAFRTARVNFAPYAGLTYRPTFYDVNAVWHPPLGNSRIVPEFQGGAGELNLAFNQTNTVCAQSGACPTLTQYASSSNHFQVHFSGGVRWYVASDLFVGPQIDVHWVRNLPEFVNSVIPEYSVIIGYTFRRR